MKAIWKFTLPKGSDLNGTYVIKMPKGAEILSCAYQGNDVVVWAKVDIKALPEKRAFAVFGTGYTFDDYLDLKHIGTLQLVTLFSELVLHVFEVIE